MKKKIISPNKGVELMAKNKSCHHAEFCSAEETDAVNIYWLAYPFVSMLDLTFALDELIKILKNWFLRKIERAIIDEKKSHETI